MEFPHTAPEIYTGEVIELEGNTVTLSGYFDPLYGLDAAVLCFYVSEDEYFSSPYEYMLDIRELDSLGPQVITAVFNDLLPNQLYYYKCGIIHGKIENSHLELVTESQVWGEVKTFETEKVVPKILDIVYNDYSYSYSKDNYSKVVYDLTVELDSPISGYVDPDCTEYGFYAVSEDNSFKYYISNMTLLDSGRALRFSISFDKDNYKMSRSPEYCYAITSQCKVGLYMIDKNDGMKKFAEKTYSGFEYTLQPRIEIVDFEQKEIETGDFGDEDHDWDRNANYKYNLNIAGALFFDSLYSYHYGSWVTPGKSAYTNYYDGKRYNNTGVLFNSKGSSHTNYIFYVAEIDSFEVESYNSIKMYFDGYGGCEITTSYYVPSQSYSKTKASDFGEYDYVSKCESVSIK